MRIAEIISGHAINGAGVHAVALTRELVARGHRVHVICRPGSWIERRMAGIAEVVPSDLDRWPLDELRRIAGVLTARHVEIVHTHMSRAHLFGVLLKRFVDIPVVATAHNHVLQPHWMLNDHVIAVSAAVARFQRRWNIVRRDRLTVIHNFVATAAFAPTADARARVRANLGLAGSNVLAGVVGNVFPVKGVHHLVEALPAVLAQMPDLRLIVVGRGPEPYRHRLVERARALGCAAHILWMAETEPIADVLAALDLLVLPSTVEPFGMVCLEGMAAGLPTVATRVGGLAEIVVHEETGLLVPPRSPRALAAAIVQLAGDARQRERLGSAGRERVERLFGVDRQVEQIAGVFERVVCSRPGGQAAHVAALGLPGFDPDLAAFRTVVLPCRTIVDLLPISHVPERVAIYTDQMRRGDRFPPVSVIRFCGRYVIADGHKRFTAYLELKQDRIVVEVWPWYRWLRDQWNQGVGNARKNARIVSTSFTDPSAAWRLLVTTLLHWRRVATSLVWRATGRLR